MHKRMALETGGGVKAVLRRLRFFSGLKPGHIERLAAHSTPMAYKAGQHIFRAGDKAQGFYLIRSGRVAVELPLCTCRGRVLDIQMLRPGDILGWSWLIPPFRYHLGARPAEPVRAFFFSGRGLRRELSRDPELGFELYRRFSAVMSQRLEGTLLKLHYG